MTRKIINVYLDAENLWALCDDGTLWMMRDSGTAWSQCPSIPQDDPVLAEVAPLIPSSRWPPKGFNHPIWGVATAGDHAMALDGPDALTMALDTNCILVEGEDEADALRCYAARDVRGAYVTKLRVTIEGLSREYLSDAIPF